MNALANLEQHLAAIVSGSDDAIITKSLDSVITSWNPGAERLFGYSAEEAIGQPITILFPAERLDEEAGFIARLRKGERIAHFETVRKRKDGSLVPISLTVSPVCDREGKVVGASKIARDISLQRKAEERQQLLLSEMRHRVSNSFAVASGLLSIAARHADNIDEFVSDMRQRFQTLAAVHSRAVDEPSGAKPEGTNLVHLFSSVLEPFVGDIPALMEVPELNVDPAAITPLSLMIFELATNAVKYGGLSAAGGGISIRAAQHGNRLVIRWEESFITEANSDKVSHSGFGTRMIQSTVTSSLRGTFARELHSKGMRAILDLDLTAVTGTSSNSVGDKEETSSCAKQSKIAVNAEGSSKDSRVNS